MHFSACSSPFYRINDVPLTAICRVIEIDLRDMPGKMDLTQRILPVKSILMCGQSS